MCSKATTAYLKLKFHLTIIIIVIIFEQEVPSASSWSTREFSNNTEMYYMCIVIYIHCKPIFGDRNWASSHLTPNIYHYINVSAWCSIT